ncbi:MAG TPA: MBOAT family O-acyltransferase [Vicinamibacterales bacterium]|nr:MBOAT family O-acyltransferase [Vicinamibacterales bacterium]
MVFSSYLFLFYFLPLALLLYYAAPRRLRHVILTVLSYVFYGWANPLFVVLLLVSTLIDYIAGAVIAAHPPRDGLPRPRAARLALVASMASNLSLLGFFKYFNFAVENLDALAAWIGAPWLALDVAFKVTLPLGISFYTFQSMSYTIDVYRGRTDAIRSFVDFACYVSMFPQLVAGPIIRFSEVADQLVSRSHTVAKFARGVAFFSLGLSKKVLLANPCGKIADVVFEAGSRSPLEAWYGVTAYAFQIYFDFSGYSDMAIGLGLMLGFVFPKNFDSPYIAQSITEFWHRWHISLSTWLRDYLYVPLGGNRKGPVRTYVNLFLVMLLGGLWHGASWNFVIWGGLHGLLLALERLRGKAALYTALPPPMRVAATFVIVLVTWVFFRAPDLPQAIAYLRDMAALSEVQPGAGLIAGVVYQPYYLGTLLIAAVIVWGAPQTWDWTRRLTVPRAAVALALLALSAAVLTTQAYNPFIYFIF